MVWGEFPVAVTDEAVDLAMAAMPGRRIRVGRRGLALARAEVARMLEAARPALCTGEREQIRGQLGGWVERVQYFSASAGGPRGTGGLSFEDRRSTENAIWLCADHGRFVGRPGSGS